MFARANRARLLLLFPVALITLFALAPAASAACPGIDPQCVTDPLDQARDSLPGSDPLTENIPKPAKDAVDTAKDTVGSTIDKVKDTVGGVLDPGGGGGPGGGGPGGGNGGNGGGDNGGRVPPTHRPPVPGGSSNLAPTSLPGTSVDRPAPSGLVSPPSVVDRIGKGAVAAAKQLGFPLVLTLIVIAFLLIQDRLDRRDPKLALAPVLPDVSKFE
jgi:hypothetical protein